MNADDFYENFKQSLSFLGPGWFEKEKITCRISDEKFILEFSGNKIELQVNPSKPVPIENKTDKNKCANCEAFKKIQGVWGGKPRSYCLIRGRDIREMNINPDEFFCSDFLKRK